MTFKKNCKAEKRIEVVKLLLSNNYMDLVTFIHKHLTGMRSLYSICLHYIGSQRYLNSYWNRSKCLKSTMHSDL